MLEGALIGESVRIDGPGFEGVPVTIRKVWRYRLTEVPPGQPPVWTFIEFETDDAQADDLAARLADALEPVGGWYCDFRTSDETYVTFAGRVFHYPRGDTDRRAEVEEYGRSVGVPEEQLDWPE